PPATTYIHSLSLHDALPICIILSPRAPVRTGANATEFSHECHGPHQDGGGIAPDRPVHEGYAAVPDVRLLQPCLPGPEGRRRQCLPQRQRAGGSRDSRQPATLFRLADLPAVVHQRRADRRLRHHRRAARERRAGAHGRRGAEERMSEGAAPLPEVAADALAGRVVIVTGAHGGLGAEAAKACARTGATVVLVGRRVPRLNRVYDAVKALGPEPAIYPMDLAGADPADYAELAAKVAGELGGLHGLLHCAAEFAGLAPLATVEPEAFVRCLHVNLSAPWLLTQACLPHLEKQADSAVGFVTDDPARV